MKTLISLPKSMLNFIQSVVKEIKLVEFPTRQETIKMTGTVLMVTVVFLIVLIILDTS
ncbi:preprotein translocase subunit SecE, partial [Candidatus Dojkabacteria bacterium]|nr:preprotein translocase subunit SecE [Candidatus Dojkabacteria bacterium]